MFSKQVKEEIALVVIKVLLSRFNSFPEDSLENRNAPFYEAFLNAFSDKLKRKIPNIPYFISLSSWLHGLSTSLGQSFFENVAHILSDGEKKAFTPDEKTLLSVTTEQIKIIGRIMTDLKNGIEEPNCLREDNLLKEASTKGEKTDADAFTADVFFQRKDNVFAIELKTVKPNASIMHDEKGKILGAKAALLLKYPNQKVHYYFGFPFDPNSQTPTGYDKKEFLRTIVGGEKYVKPEEFLIASELWEFLSGDKDAMQAILSIVNSIATPEFMDIYLFLKNGENRVLKPDRYNELLRKWFLFSELYLFENNAVFKNNTTYRRSMFLKNGDYSWNRYRKLFGLLEKESGGK